jgi:hypothetical protein
MSQMSSSISLGATLHEVEVTSSNLTLPPVWTCKKKKKIIIIFEADRLQKLGGYLAENITPESCGVERPSYKSCLGVGFTLFFLYFPIIPYL